jgi:chemotaxis protein CheY-P-specific phosphatase CheC
MKHFFTLITIGAILSSFTFFSSIEEVITAMKAGSATDIARFFDNTVEINTPDKSNSYSKSQAELVLRDFFSNNGVKNFTVNHKGENSGSQFCIGTLLTKSGIYRTTVFMKLKGDKQLLQTITFEKQ